MSRATVWRASAITERLTRRVVETVQHEGTCRMSGTTWNGGSLMRISVCNWSTDEADIDRSVEAVLRCAAQERPR